MASHFFSCQNKSVALSKEYFCLTRPLPQRDRLIDSALYLVTGDTMRLCDNWETEWVQSKPYYLYRPHQFKIRCEDPYHGTYHFSALFKEPRGIWLIVCSKQHSCSTPTVKGEPITIRLNTNVWNRTTHWFLKMCLRLKGAAFKIFFQSYCSTTFVHIFLSRHLYMWRYLYSHLNCW